MSRFVYSFAGVQILRDFGAWMWGGVGPLCSSPDCPAGQFSKNGKLKTGQSGATLSGRTSLAFICSAVLDSITNSPRSVHVSLLLAHSLFAVRSSSASPSPVGSGVRLALLAALRSLRSRRPPFLPYHKKRQPPKPIDDCPDYIQF